MFRALCLLLGLALWPLSAASADDSQKNIFASIYLKKDKIGQVHLTTVHDASGELQELTARASVSFLGVKVYGFSQEHHEVWSGGELQKMEGRIDDDGTIHEVSLQRTERSYEYEHNGERGTLPHDAFPTSPWHYLITESQLLFSIVDFELYDVEVASQPGSVKIGKDTRDATKYTFTGGWEADLWFDRARSFLKGEYDISGRRITVVVDP